ncbi:MAG: lysylphosphatidylglycerol synthase domain-containing protein [Phycisphaerae bacterium]
MSLRKKIAVSLVLSAVLLAAVVYLVGARETAAAAWQAGLPAFFTVGAFMLAVMACQAFAWAALERKTGGVPKRDKSRLGAPHRVGYLTLLEATIVAMAGNILTPMAHVGGEPGKVIYAGRKTGVSYTELAGTVLLCKYLEAMSFVLFLGFGTVIALVGFRHVLFGPAHLAEGVTIIVLACAAALAAGAIWVGLVRRWTPLTGLVGLLARLRIRRAFFNRLHGRAMRMELLASRLFRDEGGAVVPAFIFYLMSHVAMFIRPFVFFMLGWRLRLDMADLGLIFLVSQALLAVQLMPSGAGTLDLGLLGIIHIAGMRITDPQCATFLLCVRFWDAAVVATGALLAARAGVGLFRNGKQTSAEAAENAERK